MALSFVTPDWTQSGDAGGTFSIRGTFPIKMLAPTSVMHAARLPKRHCAFWNYFAVAGYGGIWRDIAGYGGFYLAKIPRNSTYLCGIDLQCSAVGRP
jgi:hypothetical protein